ncbi:chemotaxis protein CheY [Flavobacterium sp. 316]|uniref:Sigma-54 dependent transcriptional regulator n=1 Tax=Flavobacterium sediminilitoris TaxID=2024526 RepID=A0ABY4HRI0_9FLAO|nr:MULTISPECIES: sigma-54 dependent transcriptional regulator [Flavobacterium]KIX20617.1 chemotaxis protein CheY [Flavobacterium sp. 316]UOX34792.1 sigma-54 dependent transcriptional regulator [Flavobacterium sediminilitoris]
MPKILIIEDDNTFNNMLLHFLKRNDYTVVQTFTAKEAIEQLEFHSFDIILSDLRLPDQDGLSLLPILKERNIDTPFILMTAYADVKTAVKAMKMGAADYISKPFVPEEALLVLQKILSSGKKDFISRKKEKKEQPKSGFYWGNGIASIKLKKHIDLVAPTTLSVLITGENGTGKEVAAKTIHEKSNRCTGPFIAVDCGAIPKDIAGSEFFGHIKGSFTGAVNDKIGCFEAANGGTLFLDEIGNLSYENQVLLLRAIQERKIKKIGSNIEIDIDIRLLSATNENLKSAVENGSFREDLYHRLNEFSILIPSLRDRKEDLESFAYLFLEKAALQLEKDVTKISDEALQILFQYNWPGNLRELQNYIKRATLLSAENTIEASSLPEELTLSKYQENNFQFGLKDEAEKAAILNALSIAKGNKSRAAELLGVSRKTLYNKINQYKLT